jgi:hypothetical protein
VNSHHLNADLDPSFQFNADPDPARSSNHASFVSVYGPPWLHLDPLKLLNFDFNADPDPSSQNMADQIHNLALKKVFLC